MYDPDKECARIIQRINELCQESGIARNTLAKKAGISSSSLSYLLGGKSTPYLYTILLICNGLDITLTELLSEDPAGEKQPDERYETIPKEVLKEREEKADNLFQRDRLYDRMHHLSDMKVDMLEKYMDFLEQYPE